MSLLRGSAAATGEMTAAAVTATSAPIIDRRAAETENGKRRKHFFIDELLEKQYVDVSDCNENSAGFQVHRHAGAALK
jgi:hypothetical protein